MKKECKNCGSKVEYPNFDYDGGVIRCFYCNSALPNKMFFADSNVNRFAQKIPEERRDEFMGKLGFEKKTVKKTANIIFYLVVIITLISSSNKIIENKEDVGEIVYLLFTIIILTITAVKAYRDVKNPKYVKKS
ncbi:hypothetical protein ACFL1N_06140 [Thermodesulfobacteriota bacterium]